MAERDLLAERFEKHRGHLRGVAYRMLGSLAEADDAVQEAWLRLSRVCLDMLRSRTARREDSLDAAAVVSTTRRAETPDPEQEALLADSVGLALLIVLDTLTPAERLAFVLHDMFAVPFDETAPIVDRTPAAARQLASRARRRVQGAGAAGQLPSHAELARQREVVDAFLAAACADAAAVRMGSSPVLRAAAAVAEMLSGKARAARPALIDGVVGAVWAPGDVPRVALAVTIANGKIIAIDAIADPERLGQIGLALLNS